jgi:hypothetical protein
VWICHRYSRHGDAKAGGWRQPSSSSSSSSSDSSSLRLLFDGAAAPINDGQACVLRLQAAEYRASSRGYRCHCKMLLSYLHYAP